MAGPESGRTVRVRSQDGRHIRRGRARPVVRDGSRALRDRFDSRRLAETLAAVTVHDELTDDDIALVRAQSTVWISTIDAGGWPDVSYKGGDAGFVEVVSPAELRISWYDGNGMQRSLGNIVDMGRVALLFVDTERPWRVRLHGTAGGVHRPAPCRAARRCARQ